MTCRNRKCWCKKFSKGKEAIMMNPKNKQLVDNIARSLKFSTIDMITSNSNEEETGVLVDIILSSHLTSMFSCMKLVAEMCDGEEPKVTVAKFIEDMKSFMKNCGPIRDVEVSHT